MSAPCRRKVVLLGLLAIILIFMGYLAYIGIADITKSSNRLPATLSL